MNKVTVLYQSDDSYAAYMGVSIYSLFENNKEANQINVYIINDSISQENTEKLLDMAEKYRRRICFLDPKELLNDTAISMTFRCIGKRWNNHSYLKLLFARMISEKVDRLLYIDCDTIIADSVVPLFNMDMGGCPIGMVQDSLITDSKQSIGIKNTDRYYNSGVILIDTEKWKVSSCEERILYHLGNVRVYGTIDQDVLNVVFKSEILTLPVRYNLQPIFLDYSLKQYNRVYKHAEPYYSGAEIQDALLHPAIYHFLRYLGQSPWHKDSMHPCKTIFDYYLDRSPWKELEKKEGRNGLAFKLERMLYKALPKGAFLTLFNIYHEHMIRNGNTEK